MSISESPSATPSEKPRFLTAPLALMLAGVVLLGLPAWTETLFDLPPRGDGVPTLGEVGRLYGLEFRTGPLGPGVRVATALIVGAALGALVLGHLLALHELRRGHGGAARPLWTTCLGLGCLALALPPALSTDVIAYAARGELLVALGLDPYLHVPLDVDGWRANPMLMHDYWPEMPCVYGFTWAWVLAAVRSLGGASLLWNVLLFKVIGLAGYAMLLVAVWHVWPADDRRGRLITLALVGLNPTLLLETVAMAHTEGLMMGLWGLSALALVRGRHLASGSLLGLATMVKYVPIVSLPFLLLRFLREDRSPGSVLRFLGGLLIGLVVPTLGFEPWRHPTWEGLRTQLHRFAGGSPEYVTGLIAQRLTENPEVLVAVSWTMRLVGALLVAALLLRRVRRPCPSRLWSDIAAAVLILTLTAPSLLGPWYTLWALPWAVLGRHEAPRLAAAAVAFTLAMPLTLVAPIAAGSYGPPVQVVMFLIRSIPTAAVFTLWRRPVVETPTLSDPALR